MASGSDLVRCAERLGTTGAILAGGESRRMGRDKAMIEWGGGRTLLDQVIWALQQLRPPLFQLVIVGDRPEYHRRGAQVVADRYPGTGTLGGIATALEVSESERALVVACDMPLLSTRLLQRMLSVPTDADVMVPSLAAGRSDQGGGRTLETLHAIYRRTCLPSIKQHLAAGNLKVVAFFEDVRVEALDESWIRETDADLHSFMNINNPADLEKAKAIWTATKSG